jgi:putative endonuclease
LTPLPTQSSPKANNVIFRRPRAGGDPAALTVVKQPAVYILASQRNGTLYVGVTSDLVKRVWDHKQNSVEGFSKEYCVHTLVYFELHDEMTQAIRREKQIKKWNRAWKKKLIEQHKPYWNDLWTSIIG